MQITQREEWGLGFKFRAHCAWHPSDEGEEWEPRERRGSV